MRRAAALAIATLALAGCSKATVLPPGTWAGSTKADAPFQLEIDGQRLRIDGKPATFKADGSVVAPKAVGSPVLRHCVLQADATELRCDLERGGENETIELVKL